MKKLGFLLFLWALIMTLASVGRADAPYQTTRSGFWCFSESLVEVLLEENRIPRDESVSENEQMRAIFDAPAFQDMLQDRYLEYIAVANDSEEVRVWFSLFTGDILYMSSVPCGFVWCDLWSESQWSRFCAYVHEQMLAESVGAPFSYRELGDQMDVMIEQWLDTAGREMSPERYDAERARFYTNDYARALAQWYNAKPSQPRMMLDSWLEFTSAMFWESSTVGSDSYYYWLIDNFSELTGWRTWRTPFGYGVTTYDANIAIVGK